MEVPTRSRAGSAWRRLGLAVYIGLNAGLTLYLVGRSAESPEWHLWQALPANLDNPYELEGWVWSPIAAWIMAGVSIVGYWPWFVAHLAALLLLRSWWLIGLVVVSFMFWSDTISGNTFTFVFVAGVLALRGNRPAMWIFLGLLLLIPRPVALPLGVWLLWKQPGLRLPFAIAALAHAALVIGLGFAGPWLDNLLAQDPGFNIGPGAFLGAWWLVVGLPLACLLTLKGRVGWAGLAMSPYILPAYLLVLFWELKRRPMDLRRRKLDRGTLQSAYEV